MLLAFWHIQHVEYVGHFTSWEVSELEGVWYYQAEHFLKLEPWSYLREAAHFTTKRRVAQRNAKANPQVLAFSGTLSLAPGQ